MKFIAEMSARGAEIASGDVRKLLVFSLFLWSARIDSHSFAWGEWSGWSAVVVSGSGVQAARAYDNTNEPLHVCPIFRELTATLNACSPISLTLPLGGPMLRPAPRI